MSQFVEEIKRSFSHYQYIRRAASPQHLYLFGGGAMIRGLETYLSTELNQEASVWQLPAENRDESSVDGQADCLLASALGLSALAWEAT